MADNADFLETEKVVHNLSEELSKLKSAVDQIEDTKNSAKTIEESANKIVDGTTELVKMGKTILDRVDEVKFKERFDKVEDSVKTIQESANHITASTIQLLTTGNTILGRVDEVRFKDRFDEVEKLQKRNFRLSIGIIIGLLVQAVTLVFLFMR